MNEADIRNELKNMRDRLDKILANTVRTQTILEQKIVPEMAELRSTVATHESLRQRAVGFVLTLGIGSGALGGKIAHALGWIGNNTKT
jgi:hypothetical protein